jgi:peptidoglycan/xylan/chitin deacetylase (PgdA/CDA1 family)
MNSPRRMLVARASMLMPVLIVGAGCAVRSQPGAAVLPVSASTYDHGALIRGDRASKRIALVFTGGAHGEGTAPILDALRELKLKASFFVTGDYLGGSEQRELVPRMVAEGHYVGPHSHAHPLYCSWEDRAQTLVSRAEFVADLERNTRDLRSLGALPAGQRVYFIPPYEWYNEDQVRWSRALGVTLFNFTPGSGSNRDWIPESDPKWTSSSAICRNVLEFEATRGDGLNGFIMLLHLGSQRNDKMHAHVGPLLEALVARGYRFVRIDQAGWD